MTLYSLRKLPTSYPPNREFAIQDFIDIDDFYILCENIISSTGLGGT